MSASSVTFSILSRLAIILAVAAALALILTLVLYFSGKSIPGILMVLGAWGLPAAFLLGGVVVVGNIIKRRNN